MRSYAMDFGEQFLLSEEEFRNEVNALLQRISFDYGSRLPGLAVQSPDRFLMNYKKDRGLQPWKRCTTVFDMLSEKKIPPWREQLTKSGCHTAAVAAADQIGGIVDNYFGSWIEKLISFKTFLKKTSGWNIGADTVMYCKFHDYSPSFCC